MKLTNMGAFSTMAVTLNLSRHVMPRAMQRKAHAASLSKLVQDNRAAPCLL